MQTQAQVLRKFAGDAGGINIREISDRAVSFELPTSGEGTFVFEGREDNIVLRQVAGPDAGQEAVIGTFSEIAAGFVPEPERVA